MAKLMVDRVECLVSTEHSGDDLYFLVMRMDSDCKVRRVGPSPAWRGMECGKARNADVVLAENFSGTNLVAVLEEDDSYDFDVDLRKELSSGMSILFSSFSKIEKDQGRLTGMMMNAFANLIGKKRTNDDLLSVQVLGVGKMEVIGDGGHYKITTKVA